MFSAEIIGFPYKLLYTLVGTRYEANAATEKEQRRKKKMKTQQQRKLDGGDRKSVFWGPSEAVKTTSTETHNPYYFTAVELLLQVYVALLHDDIHLRESNSLINGSRPSS